METTKKQLLSEVARLQGKLKDYEVAFEQRSNSLKEYMDDYSKLTKVNDNVETLNKDLHVKLNEANERIKNLTESIKWLSTSL